ncbi:hypothetical protein AAFC00_002486 [Neodothiora populina]|uniref:Uncharacterized protein n=2 Tax=Neodothiora populina TaxID=2781224 RepID=A0ABR3P779_9PEZI
MYQSQLAKANSLYHVRSKNNNNSKKKQTPTAPSRPNPTAIYSLRSSTTLVNDQGQYLALEPKVYPEPDDNMGLMWTKGWGGKHAGGGVIVDKNGVRRAPFRFSLGKLNCFR